MKHLILSICLLFSIFQAISQAPVIDWQRCYGGSGYENDSYYQSFTRVINTNDSGYIMAGSAGSNNGDVSGNHGYYDMWVVKLSSTGNIQWQKALGGSQDDYAYSIIQTSDGGYIVAGLTRSNDGNVTGNHGQNDIWVVKLNSSGTIQWQKNFGGSNYEEAYSIIQTVDGGYIVAGRTSSNNGDVTVNHGGNDIWVIKLNSIGTIQWQKTLGGSQTDYAHSIIQTTDGGYALTGYTLSNDGDVSENNSITGYADIWVVKLSNTGNIQWQNAIGGSLSDLGYSLTQTADGGFAVAGTTTSNDGDISGNHGDYDMLVVKLNSSGSIQWQKTIGGSNYDSALSIIQTADGGFALAGKTNSNNGDVSGNHSGSADVWTVKFSSLGDIQWQKTLGGTYSEWATSIIQTADGGVIVAGNTNSNDGDVSGNHGNGDIWVAKLSVVPFSISPTKQLAICQPTVTITAVGCSGTVNWYRDLNGSGVTNQFLATGNTLTYSPVADWRQYIRATCTVGSIVSPYSNYSTVQTGPDVTPLSDIISPATPINITASGCPVGTTYLWATGETTPTITKSPNTYTVYQVKCTSVSCQSSYALAYIYVGNILANNDAYTTNVYTPISANFCTNDGALSPKTISVDVPPSHGSMVWDNTGAFTYTPLDSYTGTDSFKYYLTNSSGSYSNYATVTLSIICPTTLLLSSMNTPSDNFIAGAGVTNRQANATNGSISATNKIIGTATVTYQARSIELKDGFKADNGTVFKAQVGGCN